MPGKGGAPYGNTNAWKHGRYSRDMSLETIDALGKALRLKHHGLCHRFIPRTDCGLRFDRLASCE